MGIVIGLAAVTIMGIIALVASWFTYRVVNSARQDAAPTSRVRGKVLGLSIDLGGAAGAFVGIFVIQALVLTKLIVPVIPVSQVWKVTAEVENEHAYKNNEMVRSSNDVKAWIVPHYDLQDGWFEMSIIVSGDTSDLDLKFPTIYFGRERYDKRGINLNRTEIEKDYISRTINLEKIQLKRIVD